MNCKFWSCVLSFTITSVLLKCETLHTDPKCHNALERVMVSSKPLKTILKRILFLGVDYLKVGHPKNWMLQEQKDVCTNSNDEGTLQIATDSLGYSWAVALLGILPISFTISPCVWSAPPIVAFPWL